MKFHGIDMQGKYYLQEKDKDVELFEERRLIYDPNDKIMYFGDDSGWVGGGLASGTVMWFYQDTTPAGWTLVSDLADDTIIGVRSSGGSYNITGGTNYGNASSWDIPAHHHEVTGSSSAHNHQWAKYNSTGNPAVGATWASNGITEIQFASTSSRETYVISHITSGDGHHNTVDFYTKDQSSATNFDTEDTTVTGYRPYTRVGIICTKD